ncbi:corticotropin-releasing factor-binding protein [Cylas formicarius]|uniref:corticotropin-releasing factor-binding protein n=1 Tax=Cylas formicarius TaxID=197179 RepID=UPI00295852A3|nr:corticotropin-releasing factor-binding protein [Cylas formicarius]XP_060524551.1 corticotropin-releasing factor-binding protein [Cylas formicarius]
MTAVSRAFSGRLLLLSASMAIACGHPGGLIGLKKNVEVSPFEDVGFVNDLKMYPSFRFPKDDFTGRILPSSIRKRTPEHHILECMYMTSEEGLFYYKQPKDGDETTCGIYMFSEPDQNIEIQFNYFDVPCENKGLVAIVDGWELNGQLFPNLEDHPLPLKKRFNEFCGRRKIKHTFTSSQNVALIQYRVPSRGSSFGFSIRFIKNQSPCNVLFQADETYTLRNYGKRSNCSLSTLFPAAVKVVSLNVGMSPMAGRGMEVETGTIYKCAKRGLDDYVQIGGSPGLDNANLEVADSVCGVSSKPGKAADLIACETTTVRLVSGGAFDNSITVSLKRLTENDLNAYMSAVCLPDDISK